MKSIIPRYAGIVAAILAVALILAVYAAFGTVDLIFVKDGYEVSRQEDVSLFTEIEPYTGDGEEAYSYVYQYNGEEFVLSENGANLKEHIVYTLVTNLVTFQFGDEADDFVIDVQ